MRVLYPSHYCCSVSSRLDRDQRRTNRQFFLVAFFVVLALLRCHSLHPRVFGRLLLCCSLPIRFRRCRYSTSPAPSEQLQPFHRPAGSSLLLTPITPPTLLHTTTPVSSSLVPYHQHEHH